jgi:GTP-binding protein HflX
VYNKIDRLDTAPHMERDAEGRPASVWISAEQGLGMDLLYQAVAERLSRTVQRRRVVLPLAAGAARARLFAAGAVRAEEVTEAGYQLEVELPVVELEALARIEGARVELEPVVDGACAPSAGYLKSAVPLRANRLR